MREIISSAYQHDFRTSKPLTGKLPGPIHTNVFAFENKYFLIPFRLVSSLLKRRKKLMKTETFENALFLAWTGEIEDV